jgi:hypothetical protein
LTARVDRRLSPPSGYPAPAEAALGPDGVLQLLPLAQEICRRYRLEFPDEAKRYGDAGKAWCVHDNQHLLNWGCGAVNGLIEMNPEVAWLADVLEARNFPLDRLARNLDIASSVVVEHVPESRGRALATVLLDAATFVRSRMRSDPQGNPPAEDGG